MIKIETIEMEVDYKNIGLKVGLEVHQEISGKKLFCSCSTDLKEKNKSIEFMRKIRSSKGETGQLDTASLYEEEKNKEFIYYGYEGEYCLVETDDDPPHEINHDALIVALSVAKLFNLKIPDVLFVMRKVISDGSVVSGFQRSLLVGYGTNESFIETSLGKVRIKDLYLEEDAAKIIKQESNKIYFSLSRAGIPLLEIGTQSDIKTPEHAKETAEKIGMILRSFPNIKRGLGTIRQDVNLSIRNGNRVEIKGFQELRMIPKIIDYEIQRQLNIIKQGKKVEQEVRKANEDGSTSFLRPLPGAARMYPETDIISTKITSNLIKDIILPKLIHEQVKELQTKYNLSSELSNTLINERINFDYYTDKYKNINKSLLASLLIKHYNENNLENALSLLNSGKITKDVFDEAIKGNVDLKKVNLNEVENEIKKIIKENPELSVNAIMGMLMKKYKGKVEGKKLIELINKFSTK
ncbi:MAG: Glu-tRNA(Gln) amidotransferase subunit GatE [Nanoarchaeota archaeon]